MLEIGHPADFAKSSNFHFSASLSTKEIYHDQVGAGLISLPHKAQLCDHYECPHIHLLQIDPKLSLVKQ